MTLGEAIDHPRWREFGEYMVARGMLLGMNGMMRFGIASYSFKNYINGERYCADTLQPLTETEWEERYDRGVGLAKFEQWLEANPVTSGGNDGEIPPHG